MDFNIIKMDIQKKIEELKEKQSDCEKRISELKEFKVNLGRQIRKLETVLEHASEIIEPSKGVDLEKFVELEKEHG